MLEIPAQSREYVHNDPRLVYGAADCAQCNVRETAHCSVLGDEIRALLSREGRIQFIPKGHTLVWQGEDSPVVANVMEGVLKLSTSTSDGREQIVGVAYPSDFIGRPFGDHSPHSVTALTDSRCCLFPSAFFDHFVRENPALCNRLLLTVLDELDRARGWMLLLGRKSAAERVASFLLDLSVRLKASSNSVGPLGEFELPLDRQQIGDLLGLTVETVSRQFSALKAAGVIDLPSRRQIRILNRERLLAGAGN